MSSKLIFRAHLRCRCFPPALRQVSRLTRLGTLALAFACVSCLSLQADDVFPYVAQVASAEATVRSGPSDDFYPTQRVGPGDAVEVYRHDSDGWCAIRPLPTSFSWVAAEHLEITDNPNLARVINVPAKTHVGSHIEDTFDVEYISLRRGEIVELLGSDVKSESVDAVPARWFKIAPPAGEFRFIRRKHLVRAKRPAVIDQQSDDPLEPMDIPTYNLDSRPAQPATLDQDILADATPLNAATPTSQDPDTGFSEAGSIQQVGYQQDLSDLSAPAADRVRDSMIDAAAAVAASAVSDDASVLGEAVSKRSATHVNAVTWEAVGQPTDPLAAPEPRTFVDQYNALNIMLSRAILGDIANWKLDKLQEQTARLAEIAQTVEQRSLARGLADKVQEFRLLQQRSRSFQVSREPRRPTSQIANDPRIVSELSVGTGVAPVSFEEDAQQALQAHDGFEMPRQLPLLQSKISTPTKGLEKQEPINNSVFDASGQLIVVNSRRAEIPKYAITNRNGDIVRFVSTKDGSSLSHLVNRQVGILGKKAFIRSLKKPLIVADRVLLLQR